LSSEGEEFVTVFEHLLHLFVCYLQCGLIFGIFPDENHLLAVIGDLAVINIEDLLVFLEYLLNAVRVRVSTTVHNRRVTDRGMVIASQFLSLVTPSEAVNIIMFPFDEKLMITGSDLSRLCFQNPTNGSSLDTGPPLRSYTLWMSLDAGGLTEWKVLVRVPPSARVASQLRGSVCCLNSRSPA